MKKTADSIVILGPTASGKTKLAVEIAAKFNGEILSADSRMVYKGLDIGTGKDLEEYVYQGVSINYHLIDLVDPNFPYHIHHFQSDFKLAYQAVLNKNKLPIICGGSGLYLEAIIHDFSYTAIPKLPNFTENLSKLTLEELTSIFESYTEHPFKNIAAIESKRRCIRAIEILEYLQQFPETILAEPNPIEPLVIGLNPPLEKRIESINFRLSHRLNNGLIEEVEGLINKGIPKETLIRFGLEYKFVTEHLSGLFDKTELKEKLEVAIRQFAKRQMTYFRKMEKSGIQIHWVNQKEDVFNLIKQTDFKNNQTT